MNASVGIKRRKGGVDVLALGAAVKRPLVLGGEVPFEPPGRCVGLAAVDALEDAGRVVHALVRLPVGAAHPLQADGALVQRKVLAVMVYPI